MKLWSSRLVPGQGDIPKIVGNYKVEEQEGANEEVSSMVPTNMRHIVKAFPRKTTVKDFPTVNNSYGLGKKSRNIGKMNVITFDPGGNESIGVSKMVKDLKPGQWQVHISLKFLEIELEHPEFVVMIINSAGIKNQDIKKINDETDRIISEIIPQNVDSARVGLNVILYRYNYTV